MHVRTDAHSHEGYRDPWPPSQGNLSFQVGGEPTLLRLQNNIKLRLIQQNDAAGAEAVVARMLMLAPEQTALWWESGVLNAQAGQLQAAIEAIERFIELDARSQPRQEAAIFLQKLRDRLN